jgi:hypothetical protein
MTCYQHAPKPELSSHEEKHMDNYFCKAKPDTQPGIELGRHKNLWLMISTFWRQ